jgi:hypothetical protein
LDEKKIARPGCLRGIENIDARREILVLCIGGGLGAERALIKLVKLT